MNRPLTSSRRWDRPGLKRSVSTALEITTMRAGSRPDSMSSARCASLSATIESNRANRHAWNR
jgi:hypothetical protein